MMSRLDRRGRKPQMRGRFANGESAEIAQIYDLPIDGRKLRDRCPDSGLHLFPLKGGKGGKSRIVQIEDFEL